MTTVYLQAMLFLLNIGMMFLNFSIGNPKVAAFNAFVAGFCLAVVGVLGTMFYMV